MAVTHLTDGGLETTLIFDHGIDLPQFAAFPLVGDPGGRALLRDYWAPYLALAGDHPLTFDIDTPTWRANPDWAEQLGYDAVALHRANVDAARFARSLADQSPGARVTGVVGPRGDGYVVTDEMTPHQASEYHHAQLAALTEGGVDQAAAMTLTYPAEATGFARACGHLGLPAVVSLTVETDGRLPDGTELATAIATVDLETGSAPVGYMVNCAHPTHLTSARPWLTVSPARPRTPTMRPSMTAMSQPQPSEHSGHADCTQRSTSASRIPSSRC